MSNLAKHKILQFIDRMTHICVMTLVCLISPSYIGATAAGHDTSGRFAIHTNALWLTTTPNGGVELATSRRFSLAASLGYNAFNLPNRWGTSDGLSNPKLHHWLLTQESRVWLRSVFEGSYFGIHLLGGEYNVGGLRYPGILREYRYQGYLLGAGISYGYDWRLGNSWRIGASIGAGWMYLDYDKYDCGSCGRRVAHRSRHLATVTKASLTFAYIFPTRRYEAGKAIPVYFDDREAAEYREAAEAVSEHDTVDNRPITDDIAPDAFLRGGREEQPCVESCAAPCEEVTDTLRFGIYYGVDKHDITYERVKGYLEPLVGHEIISVAIDGYASPEYAAEYNLQLSDRRSRGVAGQVADILGIPLSDITLRAHGDDWEGLRRNAEVVMMSAEVSRILGSNDDPALRKQALRSLSGYGVLLNRVYPLLRRTEVTIIYR